MKTCSFHDGDEVGTRYGTAEARALLRRDEAELTAEDRDLRDRLLAFEEHFMECEDCLQRIREHQEIASAWKRLVPVGAGPALPHSSPWLALAASLLLVSTLSLSVWVSLLKQEIEEKTRSLVPQSVGRVFKLEPSGSVQRSGATATRVPADCPSCVLSVELPSAESDDRRYVLRILDSGNRELWMDSDASASTERWLLVHLPQGFLAAGEYALEVAVWSRVDGREIARGTYPFSVEAAE